MSDIGSKTNSNSEWRSSLITGREQFHYVFQHQMFSDVKFVVLKDEFAQPETILSHSLVLKIRSPVFEKLIEKLEQSVKTAHFLEIFIDGFEPSVFKKFVQFLYTDELENSLNTPDTIEILYIAKKYKIDGLVTKSVNLLKKSISASNASSIFQAAKDLKEIELLQKAIYFIMINATEVVQQEDFTKLNQFNLSGLVECDELEIGELDLFLGLLKWAKEDCHRHKIQSTSKHMRLVLKEVLNFVRFPLMTKDDFQKVVIPTEILSEKEVKDILRYFDADSENKQFVIPASFSCKPRHFIPEDSHIDLTKTDEANHKRLAQFSLKSLKDSQNKSNSGDRIITVSSVILEILPQEPTTDLEQIHAEIVKIKKYGLYWGPVNIVTDENTEGASKLLISFAADEKRSYGVGTVIEEIQDRLSHLIKQVQAKSFKDDLEIKI